MVDDINEDDNTIMVDMLTLGNFVSQFSILEQIEAERIVKCFVTLTAGEQDGILEVAKKGNSSGVLPTSITLGGALQNKEK